MAGRPLPTDLNPFNELETRMREWKKAIDSLDKDSTLYDLNDICHRIGSNIQAMGNGGGVNIGASYTNAAFGYLSDAAARLCEEQDTKIREREIAHVAIEVWTMFKIREEEVLIQRLLLQNR
jgi:hypothetical protein